MLMLAIPDIELFPVYFFTICLMYSPEASKSMVQEVESLRDRVGVGG